MLEAKEQPKFCRGINIEQQRCFQFIYSCLKETLRADAGESVFLWSNWIIKVINTDLDLIYTAGVYATVWLYMFNIVSLTQPHLTASSCHFLRLLSCYTFETCSSSSSGEVDRFKNTLEEYRLKWNVKTQSVIVIKNEQFIFLSVDIERTESECFINR